MAETRRVVLTALERFVLSCVATLGHKAEDVMTMVITTLSAENSESWRIYHENLRQESIGDPDWDGVALEMDQHEAWLRTFTWYRVKVKIAAVPGSYHIEVREQPAREGDYGTEREMMCAFRVRERKMAGWAREQVYPQ